MGNALTISGSKYTVQGTVKNKNNQGVIDLHVLIYDKDDITKDDFLGIGITDAEGMFSVTFDVERFWSIVDWTPDLYFVVQDAGLELLSTKDNFIQDAKEFLPDINLVVDMSNDKLRSLIKSEAAPGWVGGFVKTNSEFGYPTLNLSSLDMEKNRTNIDKLDRQMKVLWPEFSWETEPGEADPKRCYQMFAPDISRIGYTKEGKVYSIICPQQGAASQHLGSMNVEITVTGNRGWVDEKNDELAADMTVEARIWFSPSAHDHLFVKQFSGYFKKLNLPFPSSKANGIRVSTYNPGEPDQPIFSLSKGPSTTFPRPDYTKHEGIAWTMAHLAVEIGPVVKTNVDVVDKFNQFVLDIFNTASGNMLKNGNILTWNVWFTAPEKVDQTEWTEHTEKWRKSIQADHGAPDGPGTDPRFFDGTPFSPLKQLILEEIPKVAAYMEEHLLGD